MQAINYFEQLLGKSFDMYKTQYMFQVENKILQFILLFAIAAIAHALVLYFIFPGYYDPLWPVHSDFYLPAEIANSHTAVLSYIWWPRPTGMIFFALIGKFGIHGSIAAIICLTICNVVMTAILIRNIFNIYFGFAFLFTFFVYSFVLFSHSYFYSFYAHDAFSQLSYFLLITGALCYQLLNERSLILSTLCLFLFACLAFLAKETFGISALVVAGVWFLYNRKTSLLNSILPLGSILISLAISFAFNFFIKSSFVTNTSSAYKVNISPVSIFSEWANYFLLGYNLITVFSIIFIGYIVFYKASLKANKAVFFFFGSIFAFMAALIPNSLLPEHRHVGYSWTGAYIIFSLLFLLTLPNTFSKWKRSTVVVFFIVFTLFLAVNQIKNHKRHKSSSNEWMVFQENTQRNMLGALKRLLGSFSPGQQEKILITGVSFPFSPFHNPRSLDPYIASDGVTFEIVNYTPNFQEVVRSERVKDIPPENVVLANYSMFWMFGSDGRLIKVIDSKKVACNSGLSEDLKNWILFPEVAFVLNIDYSTPNVEMTTDGNKLLQAGYAYQAYQQNKLAFENFMASVKNSPQNPYSWFMTGVEYENQNNLEMAKEYFSRAVQLDPHNENPAFKESLQRIENKIGK